MREAHCTDISRHGNRSRPVPLLCTTQKLGRMDRKGARLESVELAVIALGEEVWRACERRVRTYYPSSHPTLQIPAGDMNAISLGAQGLLESLCRVRTVTTHREAHP